MEFISGPYMTARAGISLRPVQRNHLDLIYSWKNDLATAHLFLGEGKFLDRNEFRKALKKLIKAAALAGMIYDDRTDTAVGFAYAYGATEWRTSCSIAVYVAESHRYRAVGPAAFGLMARCLFFYHNFEKIKVSVAGWNELSWKTAGKSGFFQLEGTEQNELRLGSKVYPFFHLALFREDYQRLCQTPLWERIVGPRPSPT